MKKTLGMMIRLKRSLSTNRKKIVGLFAMKISTFARVRTMTNQKLASLTARIMEILLDLETVASNATSQRLVIIFTFKSIGKSCNMSDFTEKLRKLIYITSHDFRTTFVAPNLLTCVEFQLLT